MSGLDDRYLADLTEREKVAVQRWMYTRAHALPAALDLPGGWWVGLFLSRSDVFGDDASGDVDLVAGPIVYDFGKDEWLERVSFERKRQPRALGHENLAHARAASEGHIAWPPKFDYVVVCEFKASYFSDRWRAEHTGEGKRRRLLGQLRYLMDVGVRVAFVHLASTTPEPGSGDAPLRAAKRKLDDRRALRSPCSLEARGLHFPEAHDTFRNQLTLSLFYSNVTFSP